MRVLLTALFGLSMLAGCGGNTAYIPGSTGGYESPLLHTEKSQLWMGRMVCNEKLPLGHLGGDELVMRLIDQGASPDEALRFVGEAIDQCEWLRSQEVTDRLNSVS